MPEHVYTGYGHIYPESKDASGAWIGTVEPGDIRDLDEPLDYWWREATDEDREALLRRAEAQFAEQAAALAAEGLSTTDLSQIVQHPGTGEEMHGITHPADGTWSPPVSNDAPKGRRGRPVTPNTSSNQAGESGSKEE